MADFVAVIRKAVVNLSDNTPENRERVYSKARAAIRRQLEAMSPPPAEEIMNRQMSKLEDAIAEVESEHVVAIEEDQDETDRLMSELEALTHRSDEALCEEVFAALDPGGIALYWRGWLLAMMGLEERACASLERARREDEDMHLRQRATLLLERLTA